MTDKVQLRDLNCYMPLRIYGVTVKIPELVANPPAVVIPIFPVCAPGGTIAVTWISESTVKEVALIPPNVTLLAPVKPLPVMVTEVPTGPLVGLNVVIFGIGGSTVNGVMLDIEPVDVYTVRGPLRAPGGTATVR